MGRGSPVYSEEMAYLFGLVLFSFLLLAVCSPHPQQHQKRSGELAGQEITFDGEHHVEREPQVCKLYWLNRQEDFLLPLHHENLEQEVSMPCHLQGNVAYGGRFLFF